MLKMVPEGKISSNWLGIEVVEIKIERKNLSVILKNIRML